MSTGPSEPRTLGLRPGSKVQGQVAVPGSKSIAQRVIVCAALAGGTTKITALPDGDDVRAAVELVATARADVRKQAPRAITITGRPPGPHRGWSPLAPLDAHESGTLARLATAAAGLCGLAGRPIDFHVRGTLARRESPALFAALRAAGVRLESRGTENHRGWPLTITPVGPPSRLVIENVVSSQEISALLIALGAYPDAITLEVAGDVPSRPYQEMTIATLSDFGVAIERDVKGAIETFLVRGPLRAPESPISIEPDASAAAVALAAACLSGGHVRIKGLTPRSRQGDVKIVAHLASFGCDARADHEGLFARGAPTRGCEVDLEREPDLAPVIAAIAARAALDGHGPSRIIGLRTLPGKESSRIDVLAEGLVAIGLDARATPDALSIAALRVARGRVAAVELDPRGDHRMAFAFALLGLSVDGVGVREPTCVAKSWPKFWNAMSAAGARVVAT